MFLFWTIVGLSVGAKAADGTTMDEKTRRKIAEAASRANGWDVDQVRVDETEELRRPACSFYTASHAVLPIPYQADYALINGSVVGAGDGTVVAKILDSCSSGASPDWWAEIVTRFHQNLIGGLVLTDENRRTDITRKLQKAGKAFEPPSLDKEKRSLTYMMLNPETYVLYRIQVTRNPGGPVEVVKTKVF